MMQFSILIVKDEALHGDSFWEEKEMKRTRSRSNEKSKKEAKIARKREDRWPAASASSLFTNINKRPYLHDQENASIFVPQISKLSCKLSIHNVSESTRRTKREKITRKAAKETRQQHHASTKQGLFSARQLLAWRNIWILLFRSWFWHCDESSKLV